MIGTIISTTGKIAKYSLKNPFIRKFMIRGGITGVYMLTDFDGVNSIIENTASKSISSIQDPTTQKFLSKYSTIVNTSFDIVSSTADAIPLPIVNEVISDTVKLGQVGFNLSTMLYKPITKLGTATGTAVYRTSHNLKGKVKDKVEKSLRGEKSPSLSQVRKAQNEKQRSKAQKVGSNEEHTKS